MIIKHYCIGLGESFITMIQNTEVIKDLYIILPNFF